MLFAVQEVLCWFQVIHFYITMQSNQSNAIQLFFFAVILQLHL